MIRRFRDPVAHLSVVIGVVLLGSCGGDQNVNPTDTTPPAAVSNLTVASFTDSSATLTWTAPGDDGVQGRATEYDVRYSTSPIEESNWHSAHLTGGEPAPGQAGSMESFTVRGLLATTTYYFALRTRDEGPSQWSTLSNVPSARTPTADRSLPGSVRNLAASSSTANGVTLAWTAPGDDGDLGTATEYDIRYSVSAITEVNWAELTRVNGAPAPHAAGASETFAISGLEGGTRYFFALRTRDEVPGHWSVISNVASAITSPVYVDRTSRESVITDLAMAYLTRDPGGYADLLADDFRFYFDVGTRAQKGLPEFWIRSEDSTGTRALFTSPEITDIRINLPTRPAVAVNEIGKETWSLIDVSDPSLEVDLGAGAGRPEGLTYRVRGQLQKFYVRRGRNPADTDTLTSPTAGLYFLVEWRDQGFGSGAFGGATLSSLSSGNFNPQVEMTTWGGIKSLYR